MSIIIISQHHNSTSSSSNHLPPAVGGLNVLGHLPALRPRFTPDPAIPHPRPPARRPPALIILRFRVLLADGAAATPATPAPGRQNETRCIRAIGGRYRALSRRVPAEDARKSCCSAQTCSARGRGGGGGAVRGVIGSTRGLTPSLDGILPVCVNGSPERGVAVRCVAVLLSVGHPASKHAALRLLSDQGLPFMGRSLP